MIFVFADRLDLADLGVTSPVVLVSATQVLNVVAVVVLVGGVVLTQVTVKGDRVTQFLSASVRVGLLLRGLLLLGLLGSVVPAVEVVLDHAPGTVTAQIAVAVLVLAVHIVVYTTDFGAVVKASDCFVVTRLVVLLESLAKIFAGHCFDCFDWLV